MAHLDAAKSGTFKIGGEITVNRLGFGAMRITGAGIWGEPADRPRPLRTLRRLPELGVNFIDTADSYGPDVSEDLIREALHPYGDMLVATKGGLTRTGPNLWHPVGRPEYLRQQAHDEPAACLAWSRSTCGNCTASIRRCRATSSSAPSRSLLDDGLIRHAGLSEVSVEEIEAARKVFPVATVQNRYNLVDRASEAVLDYCEKHGIGFIPWYPAGGRRPRQARRRCSTPSPRLIRPRRARSRWPGCSSAARSCCRSPALRKVAHLEENVAAVNVTLSGDDFAALDREGQAAFKNA